MIRRPPRSTLLSLHDALPISCLRTARHHVRVGKRAAQPVGQSPALVRLHPAAQPDSGTGDHDVRRVLQDRKSTRLNSSHLVISYAVFCLKKKNTTTATTQAPY